MKTIRSRLFALFSLFIAALVVLCILLNAAFLERYYIYKNESILKQAAAEIKAEYESNPDGISAFIKVIDRTSSISCTIADSRLKTLYTSFPEKLDSDAVRLPGEIENLIKDQAAPADSEYIYQVVQKPGDEPPRLIFIEQIPSGEYIILKKSLKGIQESVAIANQFYVMAGLMVVLAGSLFIYYFSRKLTAPVIEISQVAEHIANLEFDHRVKFDSSDELGSLGRSVNMMAEKLDQAMTGLKQDVERRKQLVRNISHELKTPIGVIKGYAEGLKFGVAEDKEMGNRYCSVIAEECDRMGSLVQELLNLSAMESGSFQMQAERLAAGELLKRCTERLASLLAEKGIDLELRLADGLEIYGDKELLERIVINYMVNAINHAEEPGRVVLEAADTGSAIRISVFNSGLPIPEAEMDQIWDVFYKVDKARSRQYRGHGLGLSIVRLIAELHGGKTGVENKADGVLFYADIPHHADLDKSGL